MNKNPLKLTQSKRQAINSPDAFVWDGTSIILTWVLVLTVTRRLLVTQWTEDLYIIAYIANLAFLFGLALGYSRFKSLAVMLLASIYGVFFVGWRLGLLQSSELTWYEKLTTIFIRLSLIMQRISERQPVYDPLLFLLLMMVLFWVLSLNTAYALVRSKQIGRLLAPLFLAIILIHTYDPLVPARFAYLMVFSFLALLVIGRLFYLQQKEHWRQRQFYIPSQLSSDTLQISLGFVLVILVFALILPANRSQWDTMVRVWEKVKQPFQSLRQDFENAFSSLRITTQIETEFYERTLNLGRGIELNEQEIFTAIAHTKLPEQARIYWRSRVYDTYENGQWRLSDVSTLDFPSNAFDAKQPSFPNRPARLYSFTIYPHQPLQTFILPAQPHWINLAAEIEYVENADGSMDLLAVRSPNPLPAGKTYNVRSSLSDLTVEQLQQAGEDYPDWVIERYLQLPTSLSERTKDLALQITQGLATPYEKVVSITEYLRSHITYIETIDELPKDQELIDWFLFDYKKGFCNYYATAEVILLRSLGIPARLAVGYAEGTMEDIQAANVYVVRQLDAHAWPEVFFPGIGWIEFEPTSSKPPVVYPQQPQEKDLPTEGTPQEVNAQEILQRLQEEQSSQPNSPAPPQTQFPLIAAIMVFGILTLLVWAHFNRPKVSLAYRQLPEALEIRIRALGFSPPKLLILWNQSTKLSPLEKSYQGINTALSIIRSPAPAYLTPSERAARLQTILPEAAPQITQLLQHYQEAVYGKDNRTLLELADLGCGIVRLAWQKRFKNELASLFQRRE
jgi:transglutaminase-like putative cysteine protease